MRNRPFRLARKKLKTKPTLAESGFAIVLSAMMVLLFSAFYYMIFTFRSPDDMFSGHKPNTVSEGSPAEETVHKLSGMFEAQGDAVNKAKFFPKLDDAYIGLLSQEIKSRDYGKALEVFDAYLATLRSLQEQLKSAASSPQPRQENVAALTIHLRETGQRLNELIRLMPSANRNLFETRRRQLDNLRNQISDSLFPRHRTNNTQGAN